MPDGENVTAFSVGKALHLPETKRLQVFTAEAVYFLLLLMTDWKSRPILIPEEMSRTKSYLTMVFRVFDATVSRTKNYSQNLKGGVYFGRFHSWRYI